ncbi:MAG: ATP-binding protein [Bacillota bacterium]|nr:ATP-binding protein [Bacillota bacterium]
MPADRSLTAWERWVRGERLSPGEVAPHVLASWERCRGYGLDPRDSPRAVILAPEELARRRRDNQPLLSIAYRFMSQLYAALPGCCFRVSIADPDGYKLECLGGGELETSPLPGFSPGGVGENWSEAVRGTNGIGTALALDAPVFLRAEEHFFADMRRWNCSGVPIRDAEGRTLAILGLAGPAEELSPTTHGLAIAAAQGIERELRLEAATYRLEQQNRKLALLNELEQLLANEAGDRLPYDRVAKCLGELSGRRMVALLTFDPASGELTTAASHPCDPTLLPARWATTGDGPVARCYRSERAVLWTGQEEPKGFALGEGRLQAVLVQPVLSGAVIAGLLLVGEPSPAPPLPPDDASLYEAVARRLGAHVERCRLNRELLAESNMRQAILEQMDVGIVVLDLARGRVTWNRAMAPYFAPERCAVHRTGEVPRPDRAMKYPIRFAGGAITDILQKVISTGETVTDEAVILCNVPQTFRVRTGPVYGPDGRLEYILQTYTDVTSYQQLKQRKAELVAMISHELRTPLTGIKGYAQLMGECSRGNETLEQLLTGLLREISELSALVERVVTVNWIELGQILSMQSVSLGAVLREVGTKLEAEARSRNVRLEITGADLQVRGDPEALTLVFSNLIHNAVKYSPSGAAVTVRLRREGPRARVEVSDTGPGIPPEYHEDIFHRFYRVPAPETVSVPGSGLGLYIVRRLVEKHGGEVKVDSRVGRGTTFTVILPEEVEKREEVEDPRGG